MRHYAGCAFRVIRLPTQQSKCAGSWIRNGQKGRRGDRCSHLGRYNVDNSSQAGGGNLKRARERGRSAADYLLAV